MSRIYNLFKYTWLQSFILLLVFAYVGSVLINMPLAEIGYKLPAQVDTKLVSWVWSWDIHILSTDPINLFNSNIFAPFTNTLAFTETMLGTALLAWPIMLATKNIILAYNIVILLGFAISGLGMYLLVLHLTKNKSGAILAALIYAFAPFKQIQGVEHLHITGMWLPYVFLYLDRFFNRQTWKNIFLLGLFILLVFLTGFHYFIFLPIVIIIFLAAKLTYREFKFNRANIKKIIIAGIILMAIMLPLVMPYFEVRKDFTQVRTVSEIEFYSPNIIDYFASPFVYTLFYGPNNKSKNIEVIVGTGIVTLILLAWAIRLMIINKKNKLTNILIYGLTGLLSWLISFGYYINISKQINFKIPGPYALLYNFIPGFDGIRSVGRYSVFFLLCIAVFIGIGFSNYFKKIELPSKQFLIFFIAIILLLTEFSFVPHLAYEDARGTRNDHDLYTWMTAQGKNNIFLNLPMGHGTWPNTNYDVEYVFQSRRGFPKIVNGYSGYEPPGYAELVKSTRDFSFENNISALNKFKVDYLIFNLDRYPKEKQSLTKQKITNGMNNHFILHKIIGDKYIFKINYD